MLKRREKRYFKRKPPNEEISSKPRRKDLIGKSSAAADEEEKTLESLVFGGESDAIKELQKETTVDKDGFGSSDEVSASYPEFYSPKHVP